MSSLARSAGVARDAGGTVDGGTGPDAGSRSGIGPLGVLAPPVLPVVLTAAFAVGLTTVGVPRAALGQVEAYGLYGAANVVVLAGLAAWLDPATRRRVFRFRRPPVLAGAAAVVAFAVIHLPNFGVGGAIFILAWAPLPTALRLYFDDLTGAWLMHAVNNLWAYVVVAAVLQ